MKRFFILSALFLSLASLASFADESLPPVELHWKGKQIELSKATGEELSQQSKRLVESSNFHSGPGDKYRFFTVAGVQGDYRREVSGSYLVITFPAPRSLKTIGGGISVSEIVVGLNRDAYASNLFTIDDTGRVVGHSKYSGELCIQILDRVKRLKP